MTRTIPLTNGFVAIVDEEDYETAAQHRWYAEKGGNTVYAVRQIPTPTGQTKIGMHAVINRTPPGFETDHRDGDGLNNRRSNLRTATHAQNQHNRAPNQRGTSAYKGVYWDRQKRSWRSSIRVGGRLHHVGLFATEEAAASAYDAAARHHFGEFARTNDGVPA